MTFPREGATAKTSPLVLVGSFPSDAGWSSIHHMLALASSCFGTPVIDARERPIPSAIVRLAGSLPPRRRCDPEGPALLLIGSAPTDLLRVFDIPGWRTRFSSIVAWVIDSYWVDWIPRSIQRSRPFDRIFITSGEDVDGWASAMGAPPTWLPWGADVLGLGSARADRDVDVTRIGRQPPEWEDDAVTAIDAAAAGLRFHPRMVDPPGTTLDNHRALMGLFARSRFTLSFSNLSHASGHTHPTRDCITGRWVDAISAGAVVAGVAPRGDCIDRLLWPGATLELGGTTRASGLRVLSGAVRAWTPETAARQHAMALRRLDWRHRFSVIAEALGVRFERLALEMTALEQRIVETARHTGEMTPGDHPAR